MEISMSEESGQCSSKLSFVFAAAASAPCRRNLEAFAVMASKNGSAAFTSLASIVAIPITCGSAR